MSDGRPRFLTEPIRVEDAKTRFRCGKHALDDFFARHAVANDQVDAKDEAAVGFYLRYGFVLLAGDGWPRRMFVALGTLRQSQNPA